PTLRRPRTVTAWLPVVGTLNSDCRAAAFQVRPIASTAEHRANSVPEGGLASLPSTRMRTLAHLPRVPVTTHSASYVIFTVWLSAVVVNSIARAPSSFSGTGTWD